MYKNNLLHFCECFRKRPRNKFLPLASHLNLPYRPLRPVILVNHTNHNEHVSSNSNIVWMYYKAPGNTSDPLFEAPNHKLHQHNKYLDMKSTNIHRVVLTNGNQVLRDKHCRRNKYCMVEDTVQLHLILVLEQLQNIDIISLKLV